MKIGDIVCVERHRSVFGNLKQFTTIVSETKTLWKCEDDTRICKDKKRKMGNFDACYLYGRDWDFAYVVTKECKEEFEHKQWVNRRFKETYEILEIHDRNYRISNKQKEDIYNMVSKYLKENDLATRKQF
jgi:hypothetical protein